MHRSKAAPRKRAEEALQQTAKLKDEFLAVLSHELRTPLNVILGYSRMLRAGTPSPESVRTTSQIERNAVAQLRLVEDLLDVQRIVNSGLKIESDTFDLRALAESVLESLRPLAAANGLHWGGRVEPITMEGDRTDALFRSAAPSASMSVRFGSSAVTIGTGR